VVREVREYLGCDGGGGIDHFDWRTQSTWNGMKKGKWKEEKENWKGQ
jgi:hypothetical protein